MKRLSIIKRVLAVCLIFLLSINSFAVTMGDNDGSAFITKAEFDSLKNNFQAQLDSYNQAIDSKIDGAIAAYLSGVKLTPVNTYDVFNKNWNYLTAMNYTTLNQYKSVEWDLNIVSLGRSKNGSDTGGATNYAWYHVKSPDTLRTQAQKRILVDAGTQNGTIPSYVVWDGISTNLHETAAFSESWEHAKDSSVPDYYSNLANGGVLYTVKVFNFAIPTTTKGYIPDLYENVKGFWAPNFYYVRLPDGAGENTITSWITYTGATSMELKEVSGKKKTYEHIINYDNIEFDYPTDIDWVKTFNTDDSTTNSTIPKKKATLNTLIGCVSKGGSVQKGYVSYGTIFGGYSEKSTGTDYVGAYNNTTEDDKPLPSLGLIKKYYDSKHMYQYDKDNVPTVSIGTETFKPTTQDTLYNGYCIGAAKKNQSIKWKPKFINALAYDIDGNLIYTDFEINVQLSYGKYDTIATQSDITKVIKNSGSKNCYETTTGGVVSYDADINESGLIYCKWWPADNNIRDNYFWEATLDLTNVDTRIYQLTNKD